jgi:hypothetical protein
MKRRSPGHRPPNFSDDNNHRQTGPCSASLDSDVLEVKANSHAPYSPTENTKIRFRGRRCFGGEPGMDTAARSDLDDTIIVDIIAALRRKSKMLPDMKAFSRSAFSILATIIPSQRFSIFVRYFIVSF